VNPSNPTESTQLAQQVDLSSTQDGQPRRLMLIDGHSMAYRAFYALPVENFATSTGQHTNAVYGFTSMLINLLRDERPTHVAVAFDVGRHTFRTDEFPDYKATRSASPEEFRGQVTLIQQVLDALRIPHLGLEGFEADDIIATLDRQAGEADFETLIVTGDRDSFQLIDGDTTVLYPRKGVSELWRFDPAAIEEKYGVPPARYPEMAALVGETSDNLPGVPGVGAKTAAKWLNEFDGLENLLTRADQVKGKVGDSLRANLDQVAANRRLNRLVDDLELPLNVHDLARHEWDREQVHELFDALEFRVLRERLLEAFPQSEPDVDQGIEVAGQRLAPDELAAWLGEHGDQLIGLDVEGQWAAGSGDIAALALASADGTAAWVDVTELDAADEQALAAWLAVPTPQKFVHGVKGPLLAAWQRGWESAGLACDTELAAYLLRPDQRSFDLGDLAIRHLKRELRAGDAPADEPAQAAFDFEIDDEAASEQASSDAMVRAKAVVDLGQQLLDELAELGQRELLTDIEQPLARVLAKMERVGIAADLDVLNDLRSDFDDRVRQAEQDAYAALGHEVNLGSPKQLQVALFDELGLPKTKKIKSGYTTDAEAIENLYARTEHPFLAALLAHRDAIRLRQTVDGLLKAVQDDGRIHTTYLQTVAATGRLSSVEPNLQNIPIRTDAGIRIRDAFVVGDGFDGLLSADYSQIEMRVMAEVSGDEQLIEAFRSGVDFHTVTASRVYDVDPDDVTPAMRAGVKQMNYGLAYGLSAYGLSTRLGVSVSVAKELMDDYFATFANVRDYLDSVVATARRTGYTETLLGRRRYLPDLNSSVRQRREMAERMALNAPIQGTAADIIKVAMLRVDEALTAGGFKSRMLLQVHDELVLEVTADERERVEQLVRDQMTTAATLSVPLEVSLGYGPSWHAAAH